MNGKYLQWIFPLFILTSFLPAFRATAQEKVSEGCNARKKGNRNKIFRFDSYKVIESEYQIGAHTINVMHKAGLDSVRIYSPDTLLFAVLETQTNGLIRTPVRLNYVANGIQLTDSIAPDGGNRKSNAYFESLLITNSVLWTADDHAGTKTYYGIGGLDSFKITHLNGQDREMIWYSNGLDSLIKRWNEAGKLVYERSWISEKIWNEAGQLMQHSFDSLVHNKWSVRARKNWYATGILSSITFHYQDTPCLTWKYYDEKGKLIRTVKHKALKGTPVYSGIGMLPRERSFFESVYLQAAVDGLFNKDLNYKLSTLLCRADVPLEGVYTLQVHLSNSGRFTFKSIEGLHAEAIQAELSTFFNGLEKVKPAVRSGRPYGQLFELTLKVSPAIK